MGTKIAATLGPNLLNRLIVWAHCAQFLPEGANGSPSVHLVRAALPVSAASPGDQVPKSRNRALVALHERGFFYLAWRPVRYSGRRVYLSLRVDLNWSELRF